MVPFLMLALAAALCAAIRSAFALRRLQRQMGEMLEALADLKNGNGNRRLLARADEPAAPLAYEINEIVRAYEDRIADFRRAQEAQRQLMTSLSHDVRTPLATLIGYLDAVHRGLVTGEEREAYLETARRRAHSLREHMDMLFDWFRLSSDEYPLRSGRVEAGELTRNILIDWIPILEAQEIEYAVSIPERAFFVRLDGEGYARILNNLMQNVVTHSRAERIEISLCICGEDVELQLADNGVGIEAGELAHIFERLYRGEGEHKGGGLGLSIARQLAEKMGGRLLAESGPGRGTVFTLLFPSGE